MSAPNLAFEAIGPPLGSDLSLPPIVLLHNLGSCKESWGSVQRRLAEVTGRTVFAFDARNHGHSGWSDQFSDEYLVKDILTMLANSSITKATFIGHGLGARSAMLLALEKPEFVEKLIVEDMTPRHLTEDEKAFMGLDVYLMDMALVSMPSDIKNLENARKFIVSHIQQSIPERFLSEQTRVDDWEKSLPLKESGGKIESMNNSELLKAIALIPGHLEAPFEGVYNGPALFLHGTKSVYNVTNDEELVKKMFPKAVIKPIEGAAHHIHRDYPDEFVREVAEFQKNS